jgi:hypothetical protein
MAESTYWNALTPVSLLAGFVTLKYIMVKALCITAAL